MKTNSPERSKSALFFVSTDAMNPTLIPGDIIYVDNDHINEFNNKIVLFSLNSRIDVRKIRLLANKKLELIAINSSYENQIIDTKNEKFYIIGIVSKVVRKC